MLDLTPSSPALALFHQRFVDQGLPPGLHEAAFLAFDVTQYAPEELDRGRRAWQLRAHDEYRAQVAFTDLLQELTELGLSFDVLDGAIRLVRDEARHVELCRRMVWALGGDDHLPGKLSAPRRQLHLPQTTRVLRTVLGSLCIGETLAVPMLAAVKEGASDPLARACLEALVADEVQHARYGWALLEHLLPAAGSSERAMLEEQLPAWCAAAEASFARAGQRGELQPADPGRMPFGCLGVEERGAIFRETMERDVLRRLDVLGFRGHRARPTGRAREAA